MSYYWPDDLELNDVNNPSEILAEAQSQWKESSQGQVELVIQQGRSNSGSTMLIVHANHISTSRSATLFSIVHRPDTPYPVRIQPRENELPDYLKKQYHKRSAQAQILSLTSTAEQEVNNRWVADTPSEFRDKLRDAFNLGSVKAQVINLVTNQTESIEDQEEFDNDEGKSPPDA